MREITELKGYNFNTYALPSTKERIIVGPSTTHKEWYGDIRREFHVKPINFWGTDNKWHSLDEVASYYGNRNGMVLKQGWMDKISLPYLFWYADRLKLIKGTPIRTETEANVAARTLSRLGGTLTAYPDPDPETTTVDGHVNNDYTSSVWSTVRGATSGTGYLDNTNGTTEPSTWVGKSAGGNYGIRRSFYLFDTSSIGSGATINSATLDLYGWAKQDGGTSTYRYSNIFSSNPASNTGLSAADFDQVGSTKFATDLANSSYNSSGYNTFTFNADGKSAISLTGVSKFSSLYGFDIDNVTYDGGNDTYSSANYKFAESTGTSNDPKLYVDYTAGGGGATFVPRIMFIN